MKVYRAPLLPLGNTYILPVWCHLVDQPHESLEVLPCAAQIGNTFPVSKAREQSQVTQTRLAERVGLSPAAINNYEAGIRQIPVHLLLEFARFLGKPLHYFFGPDSEPALLIQNTLRSAVGRSTEASYIHTFLELKDRQLTGIDRPEPFVPVPPEIGADHDFALRIRNEETQTYDYWLCKWRKPKVRITGALIFRRRVEEYIPPRPNDWVIATIGDSTDVECKPWSP